MKISIKYEFHPEEVIEALMDYLKQKRRVNTKALLVTNNPKGIVLECDMAEPEEKPRGKGRR